MMYIYTLEYHASVIKDSEKNYIEMIRSPRYTIKWAITAQKKSLQSILPFENLCVCVCVCINFCFYLHKKFSGTVSNKQQWVRDESLLDPFWDGSDSYVLNSMPYKQRKHIWVSSNTDGKSDYGIAFKDNEN